MRQFNLILTTLLISVSSLAAVSDAVQYNDLFLKQDDLNKRYEDIYIRLSDINKLESLKTWYRLLALEEANMVTYRDYDRWVKDMIQGKTYRQLIYYYAVTGQIGLAAKTMGFYFISVHTLLENTINDPQAQKWSPRVIGRISRDLISYREARSEIRDMQACFREYLSERGVTREKGYQINNGYHTIGAFRDCVDYNYLATDLADNLSYLFKRKDYYGAPFPVSFSGYVAGNEVILHNRLPETKEAILSLGVQLHRILTEKAPEIDKPYKDLSIEEYKALMEVPEDAINKLFPSEKLVAQTDADGNPTGLTKTGFRNTLDTADLKEFTGSVLGPVSGKQLGMYGAMLQAIRDAKESVFIDLFWMGGSIGMNLAKELMKKVIDDPDFTVLIITDNENKFQYGAQLDMIYRYMRAFSEKFPHLNFYITPAQIGLKRTALPEFADLLVTNSVVNDLSANGNIKSFLEDDGFHLLAKSDHTKAMVMDGKNPELGKAFVGSKNWTDSSGGVNQDQTAEVHGPAVALILDTFYYDALEAFKLDLDPRLGGEMVRNHIQAKVGTDTKESQAIKQLLEPIDVQNRNSGFRELPYIAKGDATVAPAQNNVKGTEMSPLEQNIQMILGARHQILIDDQFLYDPKVVDAIKFAKVHNDVEIYVLVESLLGYAKDENGRYVYDSNGNFPYDFFKGIQIPNNLFMPELADLGIQTRAYVRPQHVIEAMSEDQRVHDESHPILGATFHVKSISVDGVLETDASSCENIDGPVLVNPQTSAPATVSGSANKDIMTMSGGFREAQIATYGENAVGTHDCLFWARWRDRSIPSLGVEFDLPAQAAQMGVSNPVDFLTVLKSVLFTPYNFTKDHL